MIFITFLEVRTQECRLVLELLNEDLLRESKTEDMTVKTQRETEVMRRQRVELNITAHLMA